MKSAVSRVVVAVSVVAALGASAACSSGGDDGKKPAKPGASSGSGAGAQGGAAGRLAKAALASGDVKGYEVETPDESEAGADAGPGATGAASPAQCGPLVSVPGGGATAKTRAKAGADRVLTPRNDKDLTTTEVRLSAFAEKDAERIMADLRAASTAKKCADFHVGDLRYVGIKPLPTPDKQGGSGKKGERGEQGEPGRSGAGDEAVSYQMAHRKGAYTRRETVTVVRTGGTLAVFTASNLYDPEGVQRDKEAAKDGMEGIGTPTADQDPKVAPAIVDAQLAKL
ncbi:MULTISPECIES: hypothetical protein [Streptomyces]|uniref:hypothetical protein n=1 Tax=Streptomyces TaxID=1883 RepID=UPI00114CA33D|nr:MULTISPECIES: hypothetical protein [Streptomyces]